MTDTLPADPELEAETTLPCHEKLAFQTREQAEAAAAVDAYRYADSKLKAYVCRHCGAWHLSSH
ncbi:MAG TPA: hypothetical protein VJM32_03750 [Candidatus Saccharimonadales bacterium]|nr:hypothetical protein [Candidatus Saccharimonadales bacterium]